jgi:hypothetical protein
MDPDLLHGNVDRATGRNLSGTVAAENAAADSDSSAARRRSMLGSTLLFLGIGLLGLLLIDWRELPLPMLRSWYVDRTLWVAGGLIAVGSGWYLLRDSPEDAETRPRAERGGRVTQEQVSSTDRLRPGGQRFTRLVLYTRAGCHLCDEARVVLERYGAFLPPIEPVDIDADPGLIARFSTCVPVVEMDEKVRFRGRINELLLRRLIAATPPRDIARSDEVL